MFGGIYLVLNPKNASWMLPTSSGFGMVFPLITGSFNGTPAYLVQLVLVLGAFMLPSTGSEIANKHELILIIGVQKKMLSPV